MEPITIDLELLEEMLLFGDLFKSPKPGKVDIKLLENLIFLLLKLIYLISKVLYNDDISDTDLMTTNTASGGKIETK